MYLYARICKVAISKGRTIRLKERESTEIHDQHNIRI